MKSIDLERLKSIALKGDANAQDRLGSMYDKGQGVEEDKTEAVKWYKMAAEQGDGCSQYRLGDMYYYGDGVEEDEEEAARWYKLSAEQGHPNAKANLETLQV